jgi:chaperonin GroES
MEKPSLNIRHHEDDQTAKVRPTPWLTLKNEMKIRPLQGKVLLRMENPPEQSDGGIFIPEKHREKATIGAVVRCGIWRMNKKGALLPFPVKSGQRVLVSSRVGRWLKGEDIGLKIVDMDQVLAVFE